MTIDEALALVLERVLPLGAEDTPLASAAGRVLAVAAAAALDLPPFPSSSMDGFALRSGDTPGELAVVARIAAGSPSSARSGLAKAMAISTGGAVPEGADAVVPVELTEDRGATVIVSQAVAKDANVRPRGSDVPTGATVVPAGAVLGPARLGALAAAGLATVRCSPAEVAIVVTGSELREPGELLGPGRDLRRERRDPRSPGRLGGAAVDRAPLVRDDEQALREAIAQGFDADVLVTTGGVSVGEHDLVRGSRRGSE